MALDTNDKVSKQFKLDRIGEIIHLDKKYEFQSLHESKVTDIFGFSGDGQIWITLRLNMRAYLLMNEEFPLAIPYLEKDGDAYVFHGPVANYEGIGRFVLGLIDELTIVAPEAFKTFIDGKFKAYREKK